MARIRLHRPNSIAWNRMRDLVSPALAQELTDTELDSELANHEPGKNGAPYLSEVKYLPDAIVDPHAHDEDEIIYIVEGSMRVGPQRLEAGSSLFIAKDTLYAFAAGPDGLRMLIFRPAGGSRYISKADYLRERA